MIDDFGATKLVESNVSDVFGDWGSSRNSIDNVESSSTITMVDTPRTFKDEKEDEHEYSSPPKWSKNPRSTITLFVMLKVVLKLEDSYRKHYTTCVL